MAKSTTKKKSAAKRNTASRSGSKKKMFAKKRRSNPSALGSPMDWAQGGAGVLAGVVGTRAIPQLILGEKNVQGMGYFANFVTAAGLGWVTHLLFPRNRVLMASVLAGGFAALFARVIGDFTTYGKYLSLTGGVGDYMISNAPVPSRIIDPNQAMFEVPTGWGSSMPAGAMVMQSSGAADLANGVDLGRRGGVC